MTPLEQRKLRGPVRILKSDFAEWDIAQEHWRTPLRSTIAQFRPDGGLNEIEEHYPNGSVSRSKFMHDDGGRLEASTFQLDDGPISKTVYQCDDSGRLVRKMVIDEGGTERDIEIYTYDSGGRKTKVQYVPKPPNPAACGTMYGVEGAQQAYSADGVATITTIYDDRGQPCEASFHNENGAIILRVILAWDDAGRLIKEESRSGDEPPFPIAQALENTPPEERTATEAVLTQLFGAARTMWSTAYRYDERGRQIERSTSMAGLSQNHTAWEYDEHDAPIREIDQNVSGEFQTDESGNLQSVNPKSSRREVRYEYKYDSHGNWTERVVSVRYETNPFFQRSNVERRQIDYYE